MKLVSNFRIVINMIDFPIENIKITSLDSQMVLVKEQLRQAESGILEGQLLELYSVGLKADLMDHQTQLTQAQIEQKKYRMELNKLLDFPADSVWETQDIAIDRFRITELIQNANEDSAAFASPKLQKAVLDRELASAGADYYRSQLIPDITFIAEGFYFDNLPVVPQTNVFVGAALSWPILQWGKKRKDISISKTSSTVT